jgi:23S rRNA (cytosine1962-C5)-methyltransferase
MQIETLLSKALAARRAWLDEKHQAALRLFNGFYEGAPNLVVDLYARTLVIHNYAEIPFDGVGHVRAAGEFFRAQLPWVQAILVKTRNGVNATEKNGQIIFGDKLDTRVREHNIWYALDLTLNRDASLYLDTRNLRQWAIENLKDKSVLNTFAYTGSLGVAALAGGARRVVQLDLNKIFLNVAKTSYTLNGFPINKADFIASDFFPGLSRLKSAGQTFDCVFLDPPFFSTTAKGKVDLLNDTTRLINKVRPLINDGGWLVSINNALFLSGADYLQDLEALCADGYLQIEKFISVPEDFTGFPNTRVRNEPVDPQPFNHATKIAVLKVRKNQPAER